MKNSQEDQFEGCGCRKEGKAPLDLWASVCMESCHTGMSHTTYWTYELSQKTSLVMVWQIFTQPVTWLHDTKPVTTRYTI